MSDNLTESDLDSIRWFKSSWSMSAGACVELGRYRSQIALRNSREPESVLLFTRDEIRAFLHGAQRQEFDHLLDDDS